MLYPWLGDVNLSTRIMFRHFSPQLMNGSQPLVSALKLVNLQKFSVGCSGCVDMRFFYFIKSIWWKETLLVDIYTERLSFFDTDTCEPRVSFLPSHRPFFAMTESLFPTSLLFNFAVIQAQAYAADTANYFAAQANKDQIGKRLGCPSRRVHTLKVITGRLKTLCLPHLGKINDITSALLIRRESLWDTYHPVLIYDGAGYVTIATRRSRPSRVVAIRQFPKEDTRRLIGCFG